MAGSAFLPRACKSVIDVALGAGGYHMLPRQRKLRGCVVVELGAGPLRRCVAHGAVLRKPAGGVRWIRGLGEIGAMTLRALRRGPCPLPAHMALCTVGSNMRPGQREACQIMVELRALPLHCRVAVFAGVGKTSASVIRIRALLEVGHMAARAVHRSAGESSRCMARSAIADAGVRASKRKLSGRVVIEPRSLPGLRRVAECAIAREIRLGVIGNLRG